MAGVSWWDRFLIGVFPDWGLRRIQARAAATLVSRHFEAAQGGRRTSGWTRTSSDANAASGPALGPLRELSRDLRRNNGWVVRGVSVIGSNTVGWGIVPRPTGPTGRAKVAAAAWKEWATSPSCDYDGRLSFYGLQRLAMNCIVESGEVLIVNQPAKMSDGLAIPMRLQVLEPDYLDTHRNGLVGISGGPIIDGIEFDTQGRRVAYWLFTTHPGSQRLVTQRFQSVRVPAERVLHVFNVERPGQCRGVPWLAAAILKLKDLEDFADAELIKQKVAACFAAFVTDVDAAATPLGKGDTDDDGTALDHLEPGHISYLPPGKSVAFAQPPTVQDSEFSARTLRQIAVTLGVTYEDLTGDYSNVNYSSARMARIAHWANIHHWRWNMLVPQLCDGVWRWAMEYVAALEEWPTTPGAEWSAPPMPILEPDKEGLAYQRLVRIGAMTWPQMVRELGEDPVTQLDEIERTNIDLDKRGIVLDADPRRTNSAGGVQVQAQAQASGAGAADSADGGDGAEPDPSAA